MGMRQKSGNTQMRPDSACIQTSKATKSVHKEIVGAPVIENGWFTRKPKESKQEKMAKDIYNFELDIEQSTRKYEGRMATASGNNRIKGLGPTCPPQPSSTSHKKKRSTILDS